VSNKEDRKDAIQSMLNVSQVDPCSCLLDRLAAAANHEHGPATTFAECCLNVLNTTTAHHTTARSHNSTGQPSNNKDKDSACPGMPAPASCPQEMRQTTLYTRRIYCTEMNRPQHKHVHRNSKHPYVVTKVAGMHTHYCQAGQLNSQSCLHNMMLFRTHHCLSHRIHPGKVTDAHWLSTQTKLTMFSYCPSCCWVLKPHQRNDW
jgi:hypothetical protein